MAEKVKISAVSIKKLFYCDYEMVDAYLASLEGGNKVVNGTFLKNLVDGATFKYGNETSASKHELKEVKNIHQDTWTIEESEASQDSYRNQLTGSIYRMGEKTMGEITVNFTIGQYDYATKAEFLGGEAGDNSWKRARGIVELYKAIIAVTQDDQYCFLPYVSLNAHEANTDKAIGLAIKGTAMEPKNEEISPEYWFDKSELVPGT